MATTTTATTFTASVANRMVTGATLPGTIIGNVWRAAHLAWNGTAAGEVRVTLTDDRDRRLWDGFVSSDGLRPI